MSFNKVILRGNLTRDVEVKFTQSGTPVGQFGLALNRVWYDDAQTKHEDVCFVDITAWGKTAENIAQYFKKGASILVEGYLKLDQWDDKQTGAKRSKLGVVCERFDFPGGGKSEGSGGAGGEGGQPARSQPRQPASAPAGRQPPPQQEEEDDIPF